MKRSSSKLISKAGSMRNINKVGYKFAFKLFVLSAEKLLTSSDVCITWERREKTLATKAVRVDKTTRAANFGGQCLSQEVTLFKKKKEGSNFEDKVFKIMARASHENGKVLGKIEINFAEYVDMPSFSKRVSASLSNGVRILLKVESTFIGEAKPRRSSKGSASIGSSQFDLESGHSSGQDNATNADPEDTDLTDLEIDEPEDMATETTPLPPPPQPQPQSQPQPVLRKLVQRRPALPAPPVADDNSDSMGSVSSSGRFRRKASNASQPSSRYESNERLTTPAESSVPLRTRQPAARPVDTDTGATNGYGPSKAEFDKLRSDNRQLRRKNEDLHARNADLERRLEEMSEVVDNTDELAELSEENHSLKTYIEDLKVQLQREPIYQDVVKELREAKMALAILTLEKEELIGEMRRYRRK